MALTRVITGALVAGCAMLGSAAGPASAAIPSTLTLTARIGDSVRMAELTCDPDGGTHPDAKAACVLLAGSDGDLARLPVAETHRFCPMIYMPIEATATGLWRGKPVTFQTKYANTCVRDNLSGALFRF